MGRGWVIIKYRSVMNKGAFDHASHAPIFLLFVCVCVCTLCVCVCLRVRACVHYVCACVYCVCMYARVAKSY